DRQHPKPRSRGPWPGRSAIISSACPFHPATEYRRSPPAGPDAVHPLFAAVPHNLPVGARCAAGSTGQGSVSVALSDWDRFRLREIEEHTRATDPDFVTRLDLAGVLRRRR